MFRRIYNRKLRKIIFFSKTILLATSHIYYFSQYQIKQYSLITLHNSVLNKIEARKKISPKYQS